MKPTQSIFRKVRELCTAKKILFIADEVQTGVGRLGTLWGHTQFGVEPDVMTLAKGMGGGVSVGAFMAKEEFSVLEYGDHGSTYGGNSLLCAVAAAVFNYVVDEDLPSHVAKVGGVPKSKLSDLRTKYPFITDVRGRGLLLAVEFEQDIGADILNAALERGFIMNSPLPMRSVLCPHWCSPKPRPTRQWRCWMLRSRLS